MDSDTHGTTATEPGSPRTAPLPALLAAIRPRQWLKNAFVLAPAVFGNELFDRGGLLRAATAFVAFCAVSSATYLINDLLDREADRSHPIKRLRPIASGQISATAALFVATLLAAAGFTLAGTLGLQVTGLVSLYALVTLGYTLHFKHTVILDVMFLAAGFVLRVITGAVAVQVEASEWLLLCTFLLALFLGLSKRRHELTLLDDEAANHRRVLDHYSAELLDQMLVIVATSVILCYILYTVWPSTVEKFGTRHLVYTVPFVLYGIFRYFYLVHQRSSGGDPTESLLTDPPLLLDVLFWFGTAVAVIYFGV